MESLKQKNFINPSQELSVEEYSKLTIDNIVYIFDVPQGTLTDEQLGSLSPIEQQKYLSLQHFIHNKDHGLEHEYNVYQKAIQIAKQLEVQGETIDYDLIYTMTLCHDSARTISYPQSDSKKTVKEKRNDRNHERYGGWIFTKGLASLQQKESIDISGEQKEKMIDYLRNHDFLSQQLNGKRFSEPISLEGQICRLADRISVPLNDEITRYRDTGKRLKTPFFNQNVPHEVRETMSFDNMSEYFKQGYVDEVMFFTSILMTKGSDFSHPELGKMYDERAIQKQDAVEYILEIGREEGASDEELSNLKELLSQLGKTFNFTV